MLPFGLQLAVDDSQGFQTQDQYSAGLAVYLPVYAITKFYCLVTEEHVHKNLYMVVICPEFVQQDQSHNCQITTVMSLPVFIYPLDMSVLYITVKCVCLVFRVLINKSPLIAEELLQVMLTKLLHLSDFRTSCFIVLYFIFNLCSTSFRTNNSEVLKTMTSSIHVISLQIAFRSCFRCCNNV